MPKWLQRSPLVLALAMLAAVLAAAIAVELGVGGLSTSIPPAPSKRASAVEAKLLPPLAAVAPEQVYPETTARPLFTPTRRPAPEAVATNAAVRGQYVLLGVTVAGDTRIAMLREKTSGRLHRVERGKEINGVKVAQIERDSVTLGAGDDQEVLTLQVQKAGGAAAPVAAGALPAQGPFAVAPTQVQAPNPAAPPGGLTGQPTANPAGAQAGAPRSLIPPGGSPPMPPPSAANPSSQQVPQATAPMTPEELLARRRARRTQQTQ